MKTLAVLLALGALTFAEPAAAQAQQAAYTSARLTQERMERLVARPLRRIERGDIAGAERAFERLLARVNARSGATSVEAGDHLVAMGVLLFTRGGSPAARRRGIFYMRRAAGIYAEALGPDHPEVGLTFADIGQALLALQPDKLSAEAEAALEQAWRIRRASLGPGNVETASSLATLARVRGLPSRTLGDRRRIEASAALFREAIGDFGTRRVVPGLFGSITTAFDLARMYRDNRLFSEAVEAALAAQADYRANFAGEDAICELLVSQSLSFAESLRRRGAGTAAKRVRLGLRSDIPCYGENGVFDDLYRPDPRDLAPGR